MSEHSTAQRVRARAPTNSLLLQRCRVTRRSIRSGRTRAALARLGAVPPEEVCGYPELLCSPFRVSALADAAAARAASMWSRASPDTLSEVESFDPLGRPSASRPHRSFLSSLFRPVGAGGASPSQIPRDAAAPPPLLGASPAAPTSHPREFLLPPRDRSPPRRVSLFAAAAQYGGLLHDIDDEEGGAVAVPGSPAERGGKAPPSRAPARARARARARATAAASLCCCAAAVIALALGLGLGLGLRVVSSQPSPTPFLAAPPPPDQPQLGPTLSFVATVGGVGAADMGAAPATALWRSVAATLLSVPVASVSGAWQAITPTDVSASSLGWWLFSNNRCGSIARPAF